MTIWLADSANKRVTIHRTTRADAQDIVEHGVDISRSRGGAFGQGFYTATEPGVFPGDAEVHVAIRTQRPLVGDLDEIEEQIDALTERLGGSARRLTAPVAADIRRELLRQGYDDIVVRDAGGDGIDYVIALTAASVKVIQQ